MKRNKGKDLGSNVLISVEVEQPLLLILKRKFQKQIEDAKDEGPRLLIGRETEHA